MQVFAKRIMDLGELDGAVLLFGGPYSNFQALSGLSAWAELAGIPAERVICTGDIVGYCAQPVETVRRFRDLGYRSIAGNCERQIATRAAECGCGYDEGSTCSRLAVGWYNFANAQLQHEVRDWFATLPKWITFRHAGRRCVVIHGGASDISRFLWSCSDDQAFLSEITLLERDIGPVDCVIAGHSGQAFDRRIGRHRWINAGVIGMPDNSGTPETAFAVLEGGDLRFQHLHYDAKAARLAMEAAGLIDGYHLTLTDGWWPSEEVLPTELTRQGLAIG